MRLDDLSAALPMEKVYGSLKKDISGLAYDSRLVKPGNLFVAIRGLHADGHEHIASAIQRGAVAIVVDRDGFEGATTTIRVANSRTALALLSARWYGRPADRLRMVGITGTDGKTTTTYLVRAILQRAGHQCGLIGTVATFIKEDGRPSEFTTPEAPELHDLLAQMAAAGDEFAIMEVSSHALAMDRVFGIPFEVGVFTNLSRDHLDFHGDFEQYRTAKSLLFERLEGGKARAVINRDDFNSDYIMARTRVPIVTFSAKGAGDVFLQRAELTMEGSDLEIWTSSGPLHLHLQLLGRYNVFNVLATVAVGIALELPLDAIRMGLEEVRGVNGRFDTLKADSGFTVIVDYAHTPQAMERLLTTIREMATGRLILVFGCGGDRDRGKRPQMAEVASRISDIVILTTDNPRSEDPMDILQAVEKGMQAGSRYEVVPGRQEAIRRGLKLAQRGDVLVVAGRGHERFQIVGQRRIPFLDRDVVLEELRSLGR